ncbi:MAG: HupE/UreJ family protein [Burkholderiaceae bacterium]|jgi:urease accessory protein|nr:HupE/UreJ family protein [Burkholderiaceae bacterium]
MPIKHKHLFIAALLAAISALAHAHPGAFAQHDAHTGFLSGLLHPLTGLDHLAAMLAVGIWSALALRRLWVAPLAFVALLAAGALVGFAGLAVPAVEPMIAASLLAVGLLVATRAKVPLWGAALIAAGFAFFHGAAHGLELAGDGAAGALAGMLIATASLHLAGIALGLWMQRQRRWLSASAGGSVALLGSALLLKMVL